MGSKCFQFGGGGELKRSDLVARWDRACMPQDREERVHGLDSGFSSLPPKMLE